MTEVVFSSDSGVLSAAVGWVEATLQGSLAIMIAVVAVASIGFLALTGRVDLRRAAEVILGCFIIFGASTIANGILGAVAADNRPDLTTSRALPPTPQLPPSLGQQPTGASPFDPYAGAATPQR